LSFIADKGFEIMWLSSFGRHYFCFQSLEINRNDVMIVEDNFFPDPKETPPAITVAEICERFAAAGLPCRFERQEQDVKIIFDGRKSNLLFTVNVSGNLLTATMPDESDYDADFACALFGVFDSIGWSYEPTQD
jgi:hypothetical protein